MWREYDMTDLRENMEGHSTIREEEKERKCEEMKNTEKKHIYMYM